MKAWSSGGGKTEGHPWRGTGEQPAGRRARGEVVRRARPTVGILRTTAQGVRPPNATNPLPIDPVRHLSAMFILSRASSLIKFRRLLPNKSKFAR